MSIMEIFRLTIGTIFFVSGIVVFVIEILGITHMKYVLNRLHAAAMGDTLGLFLVMTGLCFYSGFNSTSAKIVLTVILFWIASPVASHMTALLESYTNERLNRHLTFEGDLDALEEKLSKEAKEEEKYVKNTMTVFQILLMIFLLVCAIAVSFSKNLLNSLLIYMSFSLIMSVLWICLESPDLGITEAAVGAGVTSILFFATLRKIRAIDVQREADIDEDDIIEEEHTENK